MNRIDGDAGVGSQLQRSTPYVPRVIRNPIAGRLQQRHFVVFYLVPHVICLITLPLLWPPSTLEVALLVLGWAITSVGISVGFHRLFTHRSFKTYPMVEAGLAVAGMAAAGGSVVSWVSIHRRHHETSDSEGDPHSPVTPLHDTRLPVLAWFRGMTHAQFGWMRAHDYPNPLFYAKDLYRKPWLIAVNRRYHSWVILGIAIPACISGIIEGTAIATLAGAVYGGVFRIALVHHIMSSVNSFCHGIGRQDYKTGDKSTNCWWLALPTIGEAWHNNHHYSQASAIFGHRWCRAIAR